VKSLVYYNTINFIFTGGLHYKINDRLEASFNTYMGTGTTVYTGADRYSLRNLKMAQHKVELRHKNWFVRGYTHKKMPVVYNASAWSILMKHTGPVLLVSHFILEHSLKEED
jgi:hypothetical protein